MGAGPSALADPTMLSPLAGRQGAEAFQVLADGVRDAMQARGAVAGDPFRIATNIWAALHGMVTLRASLPSFPWPPLAEQVDEILAGFLGLGRG